MKKRIIAFVLSAIMVLSTVYPVQNVWADPDAEPEKQNETQVEVVTEQPGTESHQEQQAPAPTEKEPETSAPKSTETPAPQQTQPAPETVAPAPAETQAPVTEPAPTEEQTEAPAPAEEQPEVNEPEETQTEAPAPVEEQTEVNEPEQTDAPVQPTEPKTEDPTLPDIGAPTVTIAPMELSKEGVTVSGVLPVGTELEVESLDNPFASRKGTKGNMKGSSTEGISNWNYLAFYDLKLAADGENVQPDGSVQVTIKNAAVKGKKVSILHILDDADAITRNLAKLTKVTDSRFVNVFANEAKAAKAATGEDGCVYIELLDATVNGESVTFSTNSFSIYAIVDDSGTQVTYRRTYVFKDINDGGTMMQQYQFHNKAGELVDNQILKAGEELEAVGEPYHNGYTFLGWFVYDEATNTYGDQIFFEDDTNPTVVGTLTADETVIVHAKYEDVYYVTFHQFHQGADEDVIQTRKAVPAHIHRVLISDVVAPQLDSNHLFYGWSYGTTDVTIYDANNNITETYIENVTTNLDLYPYFIQAFWLRFVAGETGWKAKYVPAMFVKQTDVLTQLPVSEREGYTFGGWYTGTMTEGHISYEDQVTDGQGNILAGVPAMTEDTTLYGYWIPNADATYTVVFWKQKVTDDKNATDAQKKYDFWSSSTRTGTTGDPALATNADITKNETGFHYGRTVNNYATIQPDGSTVVNVYYDRDLMVINFYYDNGAPSNAETAYTYTATDGIDGTQYGLLTDGRYVQLTRVGQPNTIVYYTSGSYNGNVYTGTFYTRSGGGCNGYSYTGTPYNGSNLPPNNNITYYTQNGDQLFRHEEDLTEYTWTYTVNGETKTYTGTRYTRSNEPSGYEKMVTWTGLWEQNFSLESNNYTWPSSHRWNERSNGGGTTQTFLAAFVQKDNQGNPINPYNLYDQGSTGDQVIYHYIQTLNETYSQEAGFVFTTQASSNMTSFTFGNKFEGFSVSTYSTGNTGFSSTGGNQNALDNNGNPRTGVSISYPLRVYHTRNKHQIFYFSDGHQVYATGEKSVYFGAPMSTYNYTLAQVGLTERDHYTFEGWYADEACSTPYDFTGTMPNGNVTLYAKWTPNWYQIIVDPDGGIITTDIGSTYMWKQYGQTFDRYDNVVRTYIEDPNGAYKYVYVDGHDDPEGTNQVRTATYVPAEEGYTGTRYRPMTSSDPVYTLVDWYVVDPATGQTTNTPYDFSAEVEAPVWIRAVWQLTGAYQVVYNVTIEDMPYTDENGVAQTQTVSGTFTQLDPDAQYADGAEILLQGGPTNITSKFMFKGWQVVDDNGTVLDNNQGNLYHPGDVLKLKGSWANSARIIKIQPVYEYVPTSSDPVLITQLQLDANGGTTSLTNGTVSHEEGHVNSTGDVITRTVNDNHNLVTYYPVYVNERFDLNTVSSTFTREGFEFKGWNHEQAKARQGIVEFGPNAVIGMDNDPTVPNVLYAVWTRKIEVTKEWNDDDNRDGIRTTSVSITVDGATKTLDASNDWTATWTDLAEYDANGNQKDYAPLEATVPTGYTFSIKEGSNMTDGFTVVNTHVPETTTVTVAKTWSDDNNRDGVRPTTATVQLYKKVGDGAGTLVEGSTQTVGASANTWSYTWGAEPDTLVLYVYENGQQITYYVVETLPENSGYSKTGDGAENGKAAVKDNSGTIAITNSYDPQKITITVTKKWEDDSNCDGIRPTSLSLHLNGIDLTQSTIDPDQSQSGGASNEWTYTWTGLYKNERINGETKAIEYSVTEPDVPEGYELTSITGDAETGFTVTNTHTPETTSVTVTKVWDDDNDRDGIRPASVTVKLFADGADTNLTVTLTAASNWTGTFEDLLANNAGTPIEYTVQEVMPAEGYQVTRNNEILTVMLTTDKDTGLNYKQTTVTQPAIKTVDPNTHAVTWEDASITNKHVPETISVKVTKVWDDDSDRDGIRDEQNPVITLNNIDAAQTSAITADWTVLNDNTADSFDHTWEGLYKYHNHGQTIEYTVTETGMDNSPYTAGDPTGDVTEGFEIKNSYTPEKVNVTVKKVWEDNNNQDGIRPTSVEMVLTGPSGEQKVTLSAGEDEIWQAAELEYTWEDLFKYENHGEAITYTVAETPTDVINGSTGHGHYKAEVGANELTDGNFQYTVTNTHVPDVTKITVIKIWVDNEDQDGYRTAAAEGTIELWRHVDGKPDIVMKTVVLKNMEAIDTGSNRVLWEDLPVYEDGKLITYYVKETLPEGSSDKYDTEYDYGTEGATDVEAQLNDSGIIKVINSHILDTIILEITKEWDDNSNQDGKRPTQLVVKIFADDVDTGMTVTLTADNATVNDPNKWVGTIEVDKFKSGAHGEEVVYTAQEVLTDELREYYTSTGNGVFDENNKTLFVNAHEIIKNYSVTVTKIWDDNSNQDGKRPTGLLITLTGSDGTVKTYTLHESDKVGDDTDKWSYTFEGLTVYEEGKVGVPVVYTVTEDKTELTGVYVSMTSDPSNGQVTAAEEGEGKVTFTNSYVTKKTSVKVTKTWADDSDRDGLRANVGATVQLYKVVADGDDIAIGDPVNVGTADDWSNLWEGLDVYENGVAIQYYVVETLPDGKGYEKSGDGAATAVTADETKELSGTINVTNTHDPETVTIVITKTWVDNDNAANDRPTSLEITLTADDTEVVIPEAVIAKDGNTWTYTYTGEKLYKYQNKGNEITYNFTETVPNDYSAEYGPNDLSSIDDDLTTFAVTNTRKEGELKIVKILDQAYTDDQSFIFHVTGPNGANTVDLEVVIVVPAGETEKYVIITHVPIGTYSVTEKEDWSWRWTNSDSGADNEKDGLPLVKPSETTTVTFTNVLENENWLSGTAYERNVFNKLSSRSASYLPVEPASVAYLPTGSEEDDKKKREEA